MACIYKIENKCNCKVYIGKTQYNNPNKRWHEHIREARKRRSSNRALYRAILKYGVENFLFSVIEETENPDERERYYITLFDSFRSGYNETLGGDGSSYLSLNPDEVVMYYTTSRSIARTARQFRCDRLSIKKILKEQNVPLARSGEYAKDNLCRRVKQIDKITGETITVYESISSANRELGISNFHIIDVCNHKRKTCAGFRWEYCE